jgi:hypothetical protein
MRQTGLFVIGVILATAGVFFGAWWAPFPVGMAFAIVHGRSRTAISLGALIGLLAWILPLARVDVSYGIGPSAASIAGIMGFGRQGLLPILLTLLVGALLGLSGAWLATAVRQVVPQSINRIK